MFFFVCFVPFIFGAIRKDSNDYKKACLPPVPPLSAEENEKLMQDINYGVNDDEYGYLPGVRDFDGTYSNSHHKE